MQQSVVTDAVDPHETRSLAAAPPPLTTRSTVSSSRRRHRSAPETHESQIDPPTDSEVYAYLGPQRRWVIVTAQLASVTSLAGLAAFALRTPAFWIFLGLFAIMLATSAISLISTTSRRRIDADSHRTLKEAWAPDVWESIDVFLPTAGEPLGILRNTYRHVSALRWPGELNVYVLDDADRDEVRALAQEFGFAHVVRDDRGVLRKAGNLRHAFGMTSGDQIVIFDADFCPRPDFLEHLMPYMDDPAVGIVQSPQMFDTSGSMSWIERTAGSSQELFYRWVEPARDRVGAAICVGTSAIYRRSALERAGGFAAADHSEDMLTGLRLADHGFSTRYVPVAVSKGLCPDNARGYIAQQYRWAMGSVELMLSREFHASRLTIRQRLAHWSGFLFYVSTAVGVFATELPGIILLAGWPQQIHPWNYLLLLPMLWVNVVLMPVVSRSAWRYEVISAQTVQALTHIVAIVDAVRGRSEGWVATSAVGATATSRRRDVARRVAVVGLAGSGLVLAGMATAIVRAFATAEFTHWGLALLIMGAWARSIVPVVRELLALLRPRPGFLKWAAAPTGRGRRVGSDSEQPMAWPEALAWTAAFLFVTALAMPPIA